MKKTTNAKLLFIMHAHMAITPFLSYSLRKVQTSTQLIKKGIMSYYAQAIQIHQVLSNTCL